MSLGPTVLLRTEESADAIGIIEITVPPAWDGPPLHWHGFDEAFYVLEGELTLQLGEELVRRGPGSLTFAPRGVRHTLANLAGDPARYLLICTPGGFERRFDPGGVGPLADERPELKTHMVGPTIQERLAADPG